MQYRNLRYTVVQECADYWVCFCNLEKIITYNILKILFFLVVQMAEEYFNARDYGKVLT